MKFIGQFIQSLISRFRNDVYLEDVSSGTIASGGNLGLDSNNKIVKASTVGSSVDLTSEVTGTLPVGNGGTGAATLTDNALLIGNGTSAIESSTHLAYYMPSGNTDFLRIGDSNSILGGITTYAGMPLTVKVENASGTNQAGGDLTFTAGMSTGTASGGDIVFTAAGTTQASGSSTNIAYEIFKIDGQGDASGERIDFGYDDDGVSTIARTPHSDGDGGDLYIRGGDATAGQTNKPGGDILLFGGRSTGSGAGGAVTIKTNPAGSSGTSLQSSSSVATFRSDGDTLLHGNLIFEGETPDANETTFSITDPTTDRTITVPDASGTMAFLDSDITGNAAGLTASTSNSIGVGTIELGHASDCTIARGSSGKVRIEGEHVVTTLTELFGSGASGETLATRIARRTLTTAEMNSLHSTPIQIVPAPGSNIVAIPTGGMVRVDRASTNSNATNLHFHYEGLEPGAYGADAIIHLRRFHYNATTDGVYNIAGAMPQSTIVANDLTEDVNKAIEVSLDAASTTDCFTSVDIYLTYNLIQIA